MENSIVNQIPIDLKNAMLAKDRTKIAALRAIKSAFILENTKEGSSGTIDNNLAQEIILKLHKQRMDAYNIYSEQKRSDLADEEFQQAKILETYLPQRLSDAEIRKEIQEIINLIGATCMADMGKVMGKAMNSLKGKADGAIISKLVKEILS